jgi:hypothetical protein
MNVALRQPRQRQVADFPAAHPLAEAQARQAVGAMDLSSDEQSWSFQRMIAVAGAVSVVLWLGLGALVWKALTF